ncbi:MAG: type IV-A pilus assembly ATPase PilB [Proteobacteria bacterium]|jgi:type IV pilus assembly protein PilB|nr:type IV-A pilus assembly ATPase PilB [Pseudomonadota bacterium]MDA1291498.1 type IV-A pilus assembly ATPase PilB [Pseudomonadota bacterium]
MAVKLVGLARRLVAENLIDETRVQQAILKATHQDIALCHYLACNKLVDQYALAVITSDEFKLPLIEIESFDLDHCPVSIVDVDLVKKHRILPLSTRDKCLFLAISYPGDLGAIDEIAFHSGLKVELVIAEDSKLDSAINNYLQRTSRSYSNKAAIDSNLENEIAIDSSSVSEREEELNTFDETPLVRFINNLLLEAISLRASDIHFEPYESIYRIRFRIDGLLREMTRPPVKLTARLASRIKIMAHLDIAEKRAPQDGRIHIRLAGKRTIDVRVNSLPTLWGEKIVMRILDPLNTDLNMDTLGMEPQQKEAYLQALQKQQGLILVTGPTGSGKSLTLYSGLNSLNANTKNISTVEDPVEITIEGINQLAVNAKTGISFSVALRAILRQDPDIIMLGEIRDLETAEIVLRAAQTGHLVLTTLHTLSAAASLNRLRNIGIPRYNLASTISLIVAQRLARRLCEHCKESVEIPEKTLAELGLSAELHPNPRFFRAKGCADCRDGFRGRIGFYEVVPVSKSLSRIIMEGGRTQRFRKHMKKHGLLDLREAALLKVAQGLTSLEEANRLT